VKSETTEDFWNAYYRLSEEHRAAAREAYNVFQQNPNHPSLHFKKLRGHENVWSVRVGLKYRAVGRKVGDSIIWAWIGSHNDFDNLFG